MLLFNDLISLMRLNVKIYMNARACGNWQLSQAETTKSCFHMPVQGACELHVPGEGDWLLEQGDVVIFRKELSHSMNPISASEEPGQILPIDESQHLEGTSMLCGSINFDHTGSGLLLKLLPKVVVIKKTNNEDWLSPLTDLIVNESIKSPRLDNPVLNRLCEVMIVCTLRNIYGQNEANLNLVLVYAHPQLNKAVKVIHNYPEKNWNLSNLAKEVGMSRTRFSQLFTKISGITATQYLTWWRMQIAYLKLQEGCTVQDTAEHVGYHSDAAFSRAFKKEFNETVGAVRRKKS